MAYEPTYEDIKQVMQSTPVRVRLEDMAKEAGAEAQADASDLGMRDFDVKTTHGTRRSGRPFARVSVPRDGDGGVQNRLDVLARVVGRNNAPK